MWGATGPQKEGVIFRRGREGGAIDPPLYVGGAGHKKDARASKTSGLLIAKGVITNRLKRGKIRVLRVVMEILQPNRLIEKTVQKKIQEIHTRLAPPPTSTRIRSPGGKR